MLTVASMFQSFIPDGDSDFRHDTGITAYSVIKHFFRFPSK
jgi:hypothetical protein